VLAQDVAGRGLGDDRLIEALTRVAVAAGGVGLRELCLIPVRAVIVPVADSNGASLADAEGMTGMTDDQAATSASRR
jgi:hypothetical protein